MSILPVVWDGVREPFIDLVSIPGLPEISPQYKLNDHNNWLRGVLSHQIDGARIMSFHYDFAKVATSACWTAITERAINLLYALSHRREDPEQSNRPIVFICYSFGGLILKKALLIASQTSEFANILDSTSGILFLGCLHDERHPDFEMSCLRCAAVELRVTTRKNSTIESLRTSTKWSVVQEVMESFRELSKSIPVRSFFELRKTTYKSGMWALTKSDLLRKEKLCPEGLATLGWDNEKVVPVDVDHVQMSTFPSRADPFFRIFMDHLTEVVRNCIPASTLSLPPMNPEASDAGDDWGQLSGITESTSSLHLLSGISRRSTQISVQSPPAGRLAREVRLPCFITTPHEKNSDFVGRAEDLEKVKTALSPSTQDVQKQRTFAICALGGMGKTQTALHYVFTNREEFRIILWAHADSREKLAESFTRFATSLGLVDEEEPDQNTAKQILKEWLDSTEVSWLMVFDNADSNDKEELLQEYWPSKKHGSVLMTSRDKNLISQFSGIELSILEKSCAFELLWRLTKYDQRKLSQQRLIEEKAAGAEIVERIGYLPLGILAASNLILRDSCSLAEFLKMYSNQELIEDSEDVRLIRDATLTYQRSLRTVWNLSFERLTRDSKSLMNAFAFLDPDRVQLNLLSRCTSDDEVSELEFISTERKFYKCKVELLRSSLISENEELHELWIHRLVQASCHVRMTVLERQHSFKVAVSMIKQAWPLAPRNARWNPKLWPDHQACLPHIQALCQYYKKSWGQGAPLIPKDEANWDFPRLLHDAAWFLYERGLFDSILSLLSVADNYCKLHSGRELLRADIYHTLGAVATETNQFQSAFDNFEKNWHYTKGAIESGVLKTPHILEVVALGAMGNGSLGLRRYTEAEEWYLKCLEAWKGVPGDQKIYRTHLSTCLWLQGKLSEAEDGVKKIITDWNDKSNFRTGQALFALGNIQIAQADELLKNGNDKEGETRLKEAYATHKQSLILYEATLGDHHHKTADAHHKIGWHLHRKRDYPGALAELEQALKIYTRGRFFKNEIARTTYKLGCVQQDFGEVESGRLKIKRAEEMRQELVPPEEWCPALDESAYDDIVMYWTR